MNDEKPTLDNAIFKFSQESNCVDGGDDVEELEIRCESSLGIDNDEECFYILKTNSWSINDENDLKELFDRINKIIKK